MKIAQKSRDSWQKHFMDVAKLVALRSTCLRRNVGAVAVKENHILATGYNGSPSGHAHCLDVGCIRQAALVPSGERHELCAGVHAEQNIICQAAKFGIKIEGATLYCTHLPCSICAKMIVNAGIDKVVFENGYDDQMSRDILKDKLYKLVEGALRPYENYSTRF